MPRTKATKVLAAKRARDNTSEIDDILRDFDIEYEQGLLHIRTMHKQIVEDAEMELENFKKCLPPRVLKLTMGELRKLQSYDDIDAAVQQTMTDLNMTVKETIQKADEGYITGEASNKSQHASDIESNQGDARKLSTVSELKPYKSHHRSQSVTSSHTTPGPRSMMKMRTPNVKNMPVPTTGTAHMSRSRYRTPLQARTQNPHTNCEAPPVPETQQHPIRSRAASAEPVSKITPKVNPATPIAVLRHAKPGEIAFSVTGSPIVTSQPSNDRNLNIPLNNGVLMIRSDADDTAMLDSTHVANAVSGSIDALRAMKQRLDRMVANYEKRKHLQN